MLPSLASVPAGCVERTKCEADVAGSSNSLTGDSTMPNVKFLDFSGFRFGLPPVSDMNWTAQLSERAAPGIGLPFGQRTGSFQLFAVFVNVWAANCSYSDGARKPVDAAPRRAQESPGAYLADNFGFQVLPKCGYLS